ncbi:hypothetical protein FRC01_008842 [Tulasnella sp. 417]|nr:hypothetical protein FRC01_008842 [Tulasnella sp. 417]
MSTSRINTSLKFESLWNVPDVQDGLKFTSSLLYNVLNLGTISSNHSLMAQHLISRGIEILVSVQLYLNTGDGDLLKTLQTLGELQQTENVLAESIAIYEDEVTPSDPPPCDQAVMSWWHLNRNTFTAMLQELSSGGPKTNNDRWKTVLNDVVRADDLSFATRLSEDLQKYCQDEEAKKAVESIVESLEKTDDEVEKPLLIHLGHYTISAIIEDLQTEVLSAGALIGELVPLEIDDSTGSEFREIAMKYVAQIHWTMVEGTRSLRDLAKKKTFPEVKGRSQTQILYSTMRLLGVRNARQIGCRSY